MKINENISLAKSILNKQRITQDSSEYKDYLKIRQMCGKSYGYVGILFKDDKNTKKVSGFLDFFKKRK